MVEMHLSAVRVELPANTPILLLQEATGDRTLPIYIGRPEAEAIAAALQGVVTKRPMTHDLMRDILTEVGVVLDHVVITELKDQTFYAELRLRRGGNNYVVSARPSDAIAIAIRAGATIYAEEALLDAEALRPDEPRPTTTSASSREGSDRLSCPVTCGDVHRC